jgi:hypothetical protein
MQWWKYSWCFSTQSLLHLLCALVINCTHANAFRAARDAVATAHLCTTGGHTMHAVIARAQRALAAAATASRRMAAPARALPNMVHLWPHVHEGIVLCLKVPPALPLPSQHQFPTPNQKCVRWAT